MIKAASHYFKYLKKHNKPVNYNLWIAMIVLCTSLIIGEVILAYYHDTTQTKFTSELNSLYEFNRKANHLNEKITLIGDVYYDMTYMEDKKNLMSRLDQYSDLFDKSWNEVRHHPQRDKMNADISSGLQSIYEQKNILVKQIQFLLEKSLSKTRPEYKILENTDGRFHLMLTVLNIINKQIQSSIDKLIKDEEMQLKRIHGFSIIVGIFLLLSCLYVSYFGINIARETLTLKDVLIQQSFALDQSAIVAITDERGKIEFANDNFLAATGYREKELIGQNVRVLNSGRHSKEFFKDMWNTVSSGHIWKGEIQNKRKDQSLYWVDTSIVPMRKSTEDKIDGYIVIRYDITEKKHIQEDLEESQKKLHIALKSSGLGVLDWDIKTGEFSWSSEFAELLRYSMDDLTPTLEGFTSLVHPDDLPGLNIAIDEHLKLARPLNCEIQIKLKDGTYRWFQLTGQCEWTKDRIGLPERLLGGIRDINDIVLSRKEIEDARALAERSNQLKSSFLANMSHEIRTPMNAIIGMADLLSDTQLNSLQKKYVDIFQKSGESLLLIINDVLDISKIESGYLNISNDGCDIKECIDEVVELVKIKALNSNIFVSSFISPSMETAILGDALRIRQVLVNIIGNGIKFTHKGGVLVSVKNNNYYDRRGNILFTVRDSGMGIPEDHMASLFLPFVQGDSSVTKKFGGTGLGLALSKYLVEMMGGEIWVESESGKGTCFYFTLNVEHAPKYVMNELKLAKEKSDDEKRMIEQEINILPERPLKILLVDDSENNRLIVKAYLSNTNHQIDEAENGEEALIKFKQHHFDLVFMDIQMPVMDGITATKYIRQYEKEENIKNTVIVALTAYAQEEDERRFMEVGCNMHLPKPIKKSTILLALKHAKILLPA
jgi:PAS domain S-box-containing protein